MTKKANTPVALNLPKNIGAMHISNDLTLVERKLMNIVLLNALYAERKQLTLQHNDNGKKYYKITIEEITQHLGWDSSNNTLKIKEAIERLVSTTLRFNILGKQKTNNGKWNVVATLFSHAIFLDNGQDIMYCFNDVLKDIVISPTLYGTLNLQEQQNINSRYALALWEYLCGELSLGNGKQCTTPSMTLAEYVELVAGSNVKYVEFKHINKELIKEPLKEIVKKTQLQVVTEFTKEGRKTTGVKFDVSTPKNIKQDVIQAENISNFQHSLLEGDKSVEKITEKLLELGISEKKCKEFAKKYPTPHIEANIAYIVSQYKTPKVGLAIKAIEENYANHGVKKTSTQQTLDLQEAKKIEYLNLQSVEPEFEYHLKRILMEYFSPIHHSWIECLKIQSHTQELLVISLFNTNQLDTIEKNKDKFHDILHRECREAFNRAINYTLTSFIP